MISTTELSESELYGLLSRIEPVRNSAGTAAGELFDHWLGAQHGLGKLQELVIQFASICNDAHISSTHKATVICCGDHGVAEENVSAYPPETTIHMTANYLISKGAAANALANFASSELFVADLGVNGNVSDLPGIINAKIAPGTNNSAKGPAMTRAQAVASICFGINMANMLKTEHNVNVILPGEMGISNTTASAAITAALLQLPASKTTGRGTNISDSRFKTKLATVEKILAVNLPDARDPIGVLAKTGGFELGAITGLVLGSALNNMLVILDGFNSSAAALVAYQLAPAVKDYIAVSHLAGEQGHKKILQHMGLEPVMKLDIKLGEAIGSSLIADMLDMGLQAYHSLNQDDNKKRELFHTIKNIIIPDDKITLTDKTFDYYTKTMPELDTAAMELCQSRLDKLSKPIYSLGIIEKLAVQLAGIIQNELPSDISTHLLCIGMTDNDHATAANDQSTTDFLELLQTAANDAGKVFEALSGQNVSKNHADTASGISFGASSSFLPLEQGVLLASLAGSSSSNVTIAHVLQDKSAMDAFEFGRLQGENLSMKHHVVGLAMIDKNPKVITELKDSIIGPEGQLLWDKTMFLAKIPKELQPQASALLGAMLALAHNRCMIVLDDSATTALARYAVQLIPELEQFMLPVQPQLYQLGINAPGTVASTGIRLIQASLHVLNDMKTFGEAQVAVACDGPGSGRQS